jgi:hypothetical protein
VNVSGLANEVPAGSAGAPAIYPTGDSNTGIFFPAADTIAFAEGGAESARFDNTGRLTLNNSLKLSKTTATSSGEVLGSIIAEATYASPNYVASMNFFKGGFDNNIGFTFNVQQGGGGGSAVSLEAMRIDSNGNLLIGTTTFNATGNNVLISPSGVVYCDHANGTASGTPFQYFYYNNTIIGSVTQSGTTAVAYNTTSDYRLKEVKGDVIGHGERIDALQPVEYTWKTDGSTSRGFLAHQFQEVYPSSVTGEKDAVDAEGKPVYQAMQAGSSEVIADLVAEIKSLRTRITALEAN